MAAAAEPRSARTIHDALVAALAPHGLILRGGFHPVATDNLPADAGTAFLIGNAGGAMWKAFAPESDGAENPLDRWTKQVVDPIAARFSARVLYPFDAPHPPFQRWAQRAEAVYPSPLGMLIHPEFGLWHAYRAALLFHARLELPPRRDDPSPCRRLRRKALPLRLPGRRVHGRTLRRCRVRRPHPTERCELPRRRLPCARRLSDRSENIAMRMRRSVFIWRRSPAPSRHRVNRKALDSQWPGGFRHPPRRGTAKPPSHP